MSDHTTLAMPQPRAAIVSPKITREHLRLGAALYVRQSNLSQLREHQESTARQYALKNHLVAFGWPDEQVTVIDDDLGGSGSGSADRPGFRRLLNLVTEGQVGIVLGLEMSRLARNSKDWHDLFEVCAIYHALIADEDGVFDPQDPNDRLVLGLKGIIAELELHTMKVRLERNRLNKAQRGELFHDVPVGYVLNEQGLPELDPDESARHVMKTFFQRFEQLGSSHALFHHLAEQDIKLPFRENKRDPAGPIDWRLPAKTTVYELLIHPLHAGAYGYGRRQRYGQKNGMKRGEKYLPPDQWKVLIKDRHPAYITWSDYQRNQQRLRENDNVGDRRGAVRGGSALLAGLVFCTCGRRLSPVYPQGSHAVYYCIRHHNMARIEPCQNSIRCAVLDEFLEEKLLEALSPAGADLSLRVIEDEQTRCKELETLHVHRAEQARYAADLAERRFKHADPANRLVAGRLEREWETSLAEMEAAGGELDRFRCQQSVGLGTGEKEELRRACEDVSSLWREGATAGERKQIVRLLLRRVEVEVQNNSERVSVRLHWSGGFESSYEITRPVMRFDQLEVYDALMDRVLELTLSGKRSREVATILEREGFHSPRSDKPISADTVQKLLVERCREQLTNPCLSPNEWRSGDLAQQLGIPEKRLKSWVTRGWAVAKQRPFGRVWVIYADEQELARLHELVRCQTGQGRPSPPENLWTPSALPRKNP